ncbi:hypothetical protein [Sulfurimonas marina]|uniref:Copper resistance protein D domain-containing protein n=1 Tax=Sulfurimonas marina TaxID=2590551 RepID=A0A7M1AVB4_9BACT|nr:hypothetical protein [Sulfurimonas marina]QOP41365.1 hypothetical protein FJR03_06255 [Sulfurimonas marina]
MEFLIHFHLMAAMAWIGGSIFMFVLGVSLRDKSKQKEVYPNIGPIFGYFEIVSLVILLVSGILMADDKGLIYALLDGDTSPLGTVFFNKMMLVAFVILFTIIHFVVAFKTNGKCRTKLQNFLSRSSSLMVLFLNLVVLHYAIILRSML